MAIHHNATETSPLAYASFSAGHSRVTLIETASATLARFRVGGIVGGESIAHEFSDAREARRMFHALAEQI